MSQKNNGNLHPLVVAGALEKKKRKLESKFDPNKLRQLIMENKSSKEIMEIMQIKHSQILKHHVYKLSIIDNRLYDSHKDIFLCKRYQRWTWGKVNIQDNNSLYG